MSLSRHFFAGYVRVPGSSIRMPTSTVKYVYGPGEPRKIGRGAGSNRVSLIPVVQPRSFGTRATVFAVCALLYLAAFSSVRAQTLNARISVTSIAPGRIKIDARLPGATNTLSFRNTYGGVLGLGERIETVEGVRGNGERIRVQKLAPGEFQTAEKFLRFVYEVNLAAAVRPAQMSHVSWLDEDQGALMMSDLLPQTTKDSGSSTSAMMSVDVPAGWAVRSNVQSAGSQFVTDDPETAVFLIGTALHEENQRLATTNLSIVRSGKWPFSDNDAMKIARKILEGYLQITRFDLRSNAVLMLIPYAGEAGPENWSAETRGNVVVLVLGRKASGKRVLSRLGIVLSHELFHLWVPNSLKLEGDYDWFFEGFTLYQALQTDLRLGLISFKDYLETIARVYDSYMSSVDRDRLSLIEAAERRWTTSSSLVYEKGMLVAFVYDLSLRRLSECQASLDDVYAELFRQSATRQGSANETIINVLNEREGLKSFAQDYVESAGKIDLDALLSAYGIQVQRGNAGTEATKLSPAHDLNKVQRKLLGCIGYRN
jgi:predicted metalloprotease with PDZ domain